ncbi:MAG TPA: NB-ARC domain-containing protein [Stenomitos sp.]
MELKQALEVVNDLLLQNGLRALSDVETILLRGAWERQTYEEVAEASGYSDHYLRKDVGPRLWRDLSAVLGEPISKPNFKTVLERREAPPTLPTSPSVAVENWLPHKADWGEAIDVSVFIGRSAEQKTLSQWVLSDRCRFILLLGMGGIGKTALSIKVGQQIQADFTYVIWRSLRNAPPLLELLADVIKFITQQQDAEEPPTVEVALSQLLLHLRQYRCLLILDNAEAILQAGDHNGRYRCGYEDYAYLFQQVGDTSHQSCLIITSRERPRGLAAKLGPELPLRCLTVGGLCSQEGQILLNSIGQFSGTSTEWQAIIERYGGNPLALKIMASFVSEVFAGNLSELLQFLGQSSYIFGDIWELLDQQFQRLSSQEQAVMTWLAIRREPIVLLELREDLLQPLLPSDLLQVLATLRSRSLIETVEARFTQQPVVMEYVTSRLIDQFSIQMCSWKVDDVVSDHSMLQQYALLQVQAQDYIQDMQLRLILQPVLDKLKTWFGQASRIAQHLKQILQSMRQPSLLRRGYGAGNIINLLRQIDVDLSGYDFSSLAVWQADLQGLRLHNVNFAGADLSKSRFSQIFGWVTMLAFSPDGTYWAAGDSAGAIHLWFVAPERRQVTLSAHPNFIFALDISPDSQWLVSASIDGTLKLWDAMTCQCLCTLNAHSAIIWSVAFAPDGQQFVSSCEDGTIKLWDCKTGQCLRTIQASSASVRSVVFTPDSQYLVSGSADHSIRLWEVASGECIRTYEGHTETIWRVDISPDGKWIASGGNDYLIKLWDLQSGECIHNFVGHTLQIWSIAFAPDGQTLASASMDQTVRVWNLEDQQCLACFRGHSSMVMSLAYAPDAKTIASGGMDRSIKHWDLKRKTCIQSMSGYKNIIWSAAFRPDCSLRSTSQGGIVASSSLDGIVRVWQIEDGQCLKTFKHQAEVHAITFSPDGKQLVSGNLHTHSTLKIWDLETQACVMTIPVHIGKVNSVCWSPDGTLLASGGDDKQVFLFSLAHKQVNKILRGHEAVVWSVAFSPDSQLLASGSFDQRVRLWDVESGQCIQVLSGHTNALTSIRFHPSLPILVTASSDATVRLWSLATGSCEHILSEHHNVVMGIAFSSDGQTFATGSYDKTIRIWDVDSWHCRLTLQANSLVHSVTFSADDQTLVSGGDNGTLQVWNLKTGECVKTLHLPELYAGMKIHNSTGISEAQKTMLIALGASSSNV